MVPSSTKRRWPRAIACLLALLLAAQPLWGVPLAFAAGALSDSEFERLYQQGVALRRARQDEQALVIYERLHRERPSPRTLAALGSAHLALGHYLEAERYLAEALASPAHPSIVKHRRALEQGLETARRHLGWLEIVGGVPGAVVRVNRQRVATLPLPKPLRLVAGLALVEIEAPEVVPFSRQVEIPRGGHARQEWIPVRLSPRAGESHRTTPAANSDSEDGRRRARRIAAWSTLAGAVALIGVGAAGAALRDARVRDYNRCALDAMAEAPCQAERGAANQGTGMTIGGFAAGGALAITSLLLFVWPSKSRTSATVTKHWPCRPTIGTTAVGFDCGGRF